MSGIRPSVEIVERLHKLAAVHDQAAMLAREIAVLLGGGGNSELLDALIPAAGDPCRTTSVASKDAGPIADRDTLSIRWRGKTCCLGNTLAFWFFERLARRPGQLVSNQQLLDEVWDGIRSKEAIRSVVKVLRQKLREAGMEELAIAVDGSNRDHYGLKLSPMRL